MRTAGETLVNGIVGDEEQVVHSAVSVLRVDRCPIENVLLP